MMLSTRRIISAASAALSSTCLFTWKLSVMPSAAMSPTQPWVMSVKQHRSKVRAGTRGYSDIRWVCVRGLPRPKVILLSWWAALSWDTSSALSYPALSAMMVGSCNNNSFTFLTEALIQVQKLTAELTPKLTKIPSILQMQGQKNPKKQTFNIN